jgi:hypothetical protein
MALSETSHLHTRTAIGALATKDLCVLREWRARRLA